MTMINGVFVFMVGVFIDVLTGWSWRTWQLYAVATPIILLLRLI